jgi:hypothetical protein
MAEREELVLGVKLEDDQATSKLERLKGYFSTFGDAFKKSFAEASDKASRGVDEQSKQVEGLNKALGQTVQTHHQLRTAQEGVREKSLQTAQALVNVHQMFLRTSISGAGVVGALSNINSNLGTMGTSWGKVGLAVGGVAIGMVAAIAIGERFAKMLANYATTTVERQRAAGAIGVPSAQVRKFEEAYRLQGHTTEEARADVATLAQRAAEINKPGYSEYRESIVGGQRPENQQAANEALVRLQGAAGRDVAAFQRQIRIEGQGIYEKTLRDASDPRNRDLYLPTQEARELRAAQARSKFYVAAGGSPRVGEKDIRTTTEEENKQQEKADKDARDHALALNKILVAFGEATDKFSEKMTPVATQILGPISEKFAKWVDELKPEDFQPFADTLNAAVTAIAAIDWNPFVDAMKGIVQEFRAIADLIKALKAKDETPGAAQPLGPTGVQHFTLSSIQAAVDPTLANQLKSAFDRGRQSVTAGAEPSRFMLGPHEAGVDEPAPRAYEPPTRPDYTLPHIPQAFRDFFAAEPAIRVPQPAPAPAPATETPTTARPDLAETTAEWWKSHLRSWFGGSSAQPQTETDTGGHGPLTIGPAVAPLLKYFQTDGGAAPTKGEPTFAPYDRSAQLRESVVADTNKALGENTEQLKSLNDTLKNPNAMAAALGYQDIAKTDEAAKTGDMADTLGLSDIGSKDQTERIQKRLRWMHQDDDGPPEPRSYPQKSSWMDFVAPTPEIDRAALYQQARTEVVQKSEDGAASLTVDVNAPPGTSVSADADDRFHPVTINRQMQMEPAGSSAYRRSVIGPI